MEEKKMFNFKVEDGKLHISADPNLDGEPVLVVMVDIKEIPDEVLSLLKRDEVE